MLRSVFKGSKKTSFSRQMLFVLYSFIIAVLVGCFFYLTDVISGMLILSDRRVEGIVLIELFLALYLSDVYFYLYVLGIQKCVYIKVVAAGVWPSFILILLRGSIVYGTRTTIYELMISVLIMPAVIAFILSQTFGKGGMDIRHFLWEFFNNSQPMCVITFTVILTFLLTISADYRNISDIEKVYTNSEESRLSFDKYRDKIYEELNNNYGNVLYADEVGFTPAAEGKLWISNVEGLKDLSKRRYDTITDKEKLNALKLMLELDLYSLVGEANIVDLAAVRLPDYQLGAYFPQARLVVISTDILDDRDAAVECILHEVKHAHQNYTVDYLKQYDILDSKTVRNTSIGRWESENRDYHSGEDGDYDEYLSQEIEEDSRYYAYIWKNRYIYFIDRINLETNSVNISGMEIK